MCYYEILLVAYMILDHQMICKFNHVLCFSSFYFSIQTVERQLSGHFVEMTLRSE